MSEFFTADTHFGHRNIIKYQNRPFNDVLDMGEALVKNWNEVVKPSDTIWVLGDFAFTCTMEYALDIVNRLNGIKHFIKGNHDDYLALQFNAVRPGTWKTVKDADEINIHNRKITLFHYAIESWHHDYKGSWHLHGHNHGKLPSRGKRVDVGVDVWNYTPVSFWQLKEYMDKQPCKGIPKGEVWDKSDRNEKPIDLPKV